MENSNSKNNVRVLRDNNSRQTPSKSTVSPTRIKRNLTVAIICLLINFYRIFWFQPSSSNLVQHLGGFSDANGSGIGSTGGSDSVGYDEEKCNAAIKQALDSPAIIAYTQSLGTELKENIISSSMELVSLHFAAVVGDYVNVDSSSSSTTSDSCEEKGVATLAAAIAQRAAMNEPYCNTPNTIPKRDIWFAMKEGNCAKKVKKMFEDEKFHVTLGNSGASVGGSGVPAVHLMVGPFNYTLPHSPIRDIAMMSYTGRGSEGEAYTDILHTLFALYRRVRMHGHVTMNSCYDECKQGKDEFFTDGNHTLLSTTPSIQSFSKRDAQVRIPPAFRSSVMGTDRKGLIIDPKVNKAWDLLKVWHEETIRKFWGHVGGNPYQTTRYIEAMKHTITQQKLVSKAEGRKDITVNVCETGFNGGHSAMLFLAFLNKAEGINVNYYGWDLKQVGSALPTSKKMEEKFGNNFHITWGDSKETLTKAAEFMGDERCHLVVIDGEHRKIGVVNDLQNFLKVAHHGAIVFGDDCAPYKRTVPKSEEMLEGWLEFVERGEIISVANYRNPDLGSPGFVEGVVPGVDGSYNLGL